MTIVYLDLSINIYNTYYNIYKAMAFQTQKSFNTKALAPKHSCGIDRFSTPLFRLGEFNISFDLF